MDRIKSDEALNGEKAISLIKERMDQFAAGTAETLYKLILLDYSMPGMDGPTVAKEIHRLYRESEVITEAQIPYICCVSAYTDAQFKKTALESGMNHFLNKPVTKESLDLLTALLK